METNHKGDTCPYRSLTCQEGYCQGCEVYNEAIKTKELCPVCDVDIRVWEEVFGEPHYCNPIWNNNMRERNDKI